MPSTSNLLPLTIKHADFEDVFLWNPSSRQSLTEYIKHTLRENCELEIDERNQEHMNLIWALQKDLQMQLKQYQFWRQLSKSEIEMDRKKGNLMISIEVEVGVVRLSDSFPWDPHSNLVDPREFAVAFCDDLGVERRFVEAITIQIKNQVQEHLFNLWSRRESNSPRWPISSSVIQKDYPSPPKIFINNHP